MAWIKILEDDTVGQFFDNIGTIPFFLSDMNLSFDHEGDLMPPNRLKIVHPTGTHALFKFVSKGNHDYTGSLRGTDYGILRISEVANPRKGDKPGTSAAFKFYRDGVAAGDMVTVHNFNGHKQTYNFLRKDIDYNTHVDLTDNDCLNKTIHAKFAQSTDHIGNMSVKALSDYDQYGNRELNPKWPFNMRYVPTDPCKSPDEWHGTYIEEETSGCIPPGTLLFEVMALDEPEALGGVEKHIGDLITTSPVVSSLWGDTQLFFRHTRFEEDIAERPHWKDHVETFPTGKFHEILPLPLETSGKCPFAFIFGLI